MGSLNVKKIKWQDKYCIGVVEIDMQHQFFARLVNRLIDELKRSDEMGHKFRLLEELSLYASFHFISEENMMIGHRYPHIDEHKSIHRKLLSQLNDRINYYKLSKETEETILGFLIDWFVNHTADEDRAFGKFLRKNNTL